MAVNLSKTPPVKYVAIINVPGYLPEGDPQEFYTAADAWRWLAQERRDSEESGADSYDGHLPDCRWNDAAPFTDSVLEMEEYAEQDVPGTVMVDTPGRCQCPESPEQSPTDLGLAYSVQVAE